MDQAPVVRGKSKPTSETTNDIQIVTSAGRKAAAEAAMAEMKMAQMAGTLVEASSVDRECRNAVALMNASFEKAVTAIAEEASSKYGFDEKTMRKLLKKFRVEGLSVFNQKMLALQSDQTNDLTVGDKSYLGGQETQTLQ